MKVFKMLLLVLGLNGLAFAGPGAPGHSHSHDHEISKSQAEEAGSMVVKKLLEKGKIESSWKAANLLTADKKHFKKREEWVVVFENRNASNPKQQKLYIFLTTTGKYIAANFTGN